jgi:hypothetical protein
MGIYDTTKEYGLEALDKARRFKEWQAKKYHDFQKWQKDMGYDDRSIWSDISDWAGFTGTDAPAFDPNLRGTGKKDSLIGVKIPDAWKSYDTEKIAKEKGIELTPFADTVLRSDELIKDTVRWPLNAIQSGIEWLPNVPHLTKTAAQEAHAALDKTKKREGSGAWWTQTQDWLGNHPATPYIPFLWSMKPTNMEDDYNEFWSDAAPPALKEDGTPYDPIKDKKYKDAGGETWHDRDLSNWPLYQHYKSGMGWDNADQRRIDKRVEATMKNKPIPPDEILQDFYKLARENMDTPLGQNGVTGSDLVASPEAVNYYFKQYFDGVKERARNNLSNEYEFQKTGQKFADWMSKEYRDEMVKKYGMYPVWEDGANFEGGETLSQLEMLSGNISPFGESAPANLSLANEDYINALKAGKEDIGEPLEWSYGAYDRSPGYGIPEEHKKWFEYGTKEAEKLFESNQAVAAEFAALYFARAPLALRKPIQNWLQTTKTGRAIRELMPGLFQHGSRANFGIRKMATMYDTGKRSWWRTGVNAATGTIDFIRPKGGQFLGAIALGEMGSNWDRN